MTAKPKVSKPKVQRKAPTKQLLAELGTTPKQLAAHGLSPLEYMLRIMRDSKVSRDMRLKAAVAAAPYAHPKLAQVDHTVGNAAGKPFVIQATLGDEGIL